MRTRYPPCPGHNGKLQRQSQPQKNSGNIKIRRLEFVEHHVGVGGKDGGIQHHEGNARRRPGDRDKKPDAAEYDRHATDQNQFPVPGQIRGHDRHEGFRGPKMLDTVCDHQDRQ